jgi:hypothetical protein
MLPTASSQQQAAEVTNLQQVADQRSDGSLACSDGWSTLGCARCTAVSAKALVKHKVNLQLYQQAVLWQVLQPLLLQLIKPTHQKQV